MSVRKREWITRRGEAKEAWIVDYVDQAGKRQVKQFKKRKLADDYLTTAKHEVREGVHTPVSKSITIAKAAEDWLGYVGGEGRERSTVERYEQLVRLHIIPRLGNEKLAKLTTPRINAFRDDLLKDISRPTARKVLAALKALLKDAKRRGNVAQNVLPLMFRSKSLSAIGLISKLARAFRLAMKSNASSMRPSPGRVGRCY